ncbi:MAG TPA: hypothetical protein VEQ87_16230 [Burkholderiales bacterium]|nr:hypothetical protein [Burkholderiales bacterium]
MGTDRAKPFRQLSREEFEQLSLDERMEYLHRAMNELREKIAQTRNKHTTVGTRRQIRTEEAGEAAKK